MAMRKVTKPREIIDRKAVLGELEEILNWSGFTSDSQNEVFAVYKKAMAHGRAEIQRRFEAGEQSGSKTVFAGAFLVDQLVRLIFDVATEHAYPIGVETKDDVMSVIATGGYGRGELAPHSDIDLMFLLPYKVTPRAEQVVEYMLYTLWDLDLKVGHATRSSADAIRLANEDITIRTSLLESRLITGDGAQYDQFEIDFKKQVLDGTGPAFVEAKLAERDARHNRLGDTRYVLEPNIKDGKGGLRDLQTLMWISKYLLDATTIDELKFKNVITAEDARRFNKAQEFLWTARCHLHYLAGRPEERLTFNIQSEIGERMAYTDHAGLSGVERFMKHYFLIAKDVGDLTRIICATLEEQHKKKRRKFRMPLFGASGPKIDGFKVDGDRILVADKDLFKKQPSKLLDLFWQAQKHDLDIHPEALRQVTKNLKKITRKVQNDPEANEIFINILTGPEPDVTLMRMNEAGVFGKFVPDFGRVVAQMQYDMYHVYTVDEHTIRAIGILNGIETGRLADDHPVSCEIVSEIQSRRVLYVAVLLHDIAKGRGGDHSELGADVALKLCPRFGLNEWETETVSWLVLKHLLMSNTAFKRDVDDPKTVFDFVGEVQSPERLRLLMVLTVADIRAVGPNVWNAWKAGLLRELYWRAAEVMSGEMPQERMSKRAETAKGRLSGALTDNLGWTAKAVTDHLDLARDSYWLSFDTETLVGHAELIKRANDENQELLIEFRTDEEHDATEVLVYTADHPGLFSKVAGALSLGGVSIVDAKITTLNNSMALDIFWVQDAQSEAISGESRMDRIRSRIERALSGMSSPAYELREARANAMPSRTNVFTVPPRVLIDNKASRTHTVIEVNGRDRLGFLHDITDAITQAALQISSAHISTYGERVVDVFYVKDVFGLKMEQETKIEEVRQKILRAIEQNADAEKPEAAE
jgi:[protein-PII] uridylyltransferase